MQDHNPPFNSLMLVIGIIIGVLVGVVVFTTIDSLGSRGELALDDPDVQAEIAARLEPVGRVVLMGADELGAAATSSATEEARPTLSGPEVYSQACSACHAPTAPDVLGAPKIDDAAAWAPRVAQGMDVLTQHAINGFEGSAGIMPARGGRMDLSDEEVIDAIQYMVDEATGP